MRRALWTVAMIAMCFECASATYYVRKDGNDANSGLAYNSAGAWLTISKAASSVSAGDTVLVGDGSYSERTLTQVSGSSGSPITFSSYSGSVTSGGWVLRHPWYRVNGFTLNDYGISGYEGVIEFRSSGNNALITSNTLTSTSPYAYLVTTTSGSFTTNATFLWNSFGETMSHALILVGAGHLVASNVLSTANGGDALKIHSDNTTILRNTVTNWSNIARTGGSLTIGSTYYFESTNGSPDFSNVGAGSPPYTLGEGVTFTVTNSTPASWGSASVIRANHTDLVQTFAYDPSDSSTNVVIDGNLFANCSNCQIGNIEDQARLGKVGSWTWRNNVFANVAWVISIYARDFSFYNNTFYRSGTNSGHPLIFTTSTDRGNAHGGQVFNNIFVECGSQPDTTTRGWYDFGVGLTNCAADYNMVVGTGAGTTKTGFATGVLETHGINGISPTFTSAATTDFTMAVGSEGYASGTDLSESFTTDKAGTSRTVPWSIGAYEQDSGSSAQTISIGTATVGTLRTP